MLLALFLFPMAAGMYLVYLAHVAFYLFNFCYLPYAYFLWMLAYYLLSLLSSRSFLPIGLLLLRLRLFPMDAGILYLVYFYFYLLLSVSYHINCIAARCPINMAYLTTCVFIRS